MVLLTNANTEVFGYVGHTKQQCPSEDVDTAFAVAIP